MEAVIKPVSPPVLLPVLEKACEYIAPTWPLDNMIAVNPFWELRGLPAAEVAARVAALVRGTPLQTPDYYAALDNPRIEDRHLVAAARQLGIETNAKALRIELGHNDSAAHWHNVSEFLDSNRDTEREMTWHEEIIHQISQFCAQYFQQIDTPEPSAGAGTLYKQWIETARIDLGLPIIMGERNLLDQFEALPADRDTLFKIAGAELGLDEQSAEIYAHALLLDINGWASWVAYLRWQARLGQKDDDMMLDLLAIRMGWELAMWRHVAEHDRLAFRRLRYYWQQQLATPNELIGVHRNNQQRLWIWQTAAEFAYQEELAQRILPPPINTSKQPIELQAVFCIDVRSEVFRRHLEVQSDAIETRGFAGFFGLPLEYKLAGSDFARPQLPGLLAPALQVENPSANRPKLAQAGRKAHWKHLSDNPSSMFGLVETSGPFYAFKLLRDAFFPHRETHAVNDLDDKHNLQISRDGTPLSTEELADLASKVLHAMGLEKDFAPTVVLVGHGSASTNNPHAASLDCGACGGQTGEINSRVLAALLNAKEVRAALADKGIFIPDSTSFVAALHNTTTDEITTFGDAEIPTRQLTWLEQAGEATRADRAKRLSSSPLTQADLIGSMQSRARDWSQVRPEWGLANNAAFIVAPRARTRNVDLQGRVFLHDYDWQEDHDFSVLELIMTAPMIVTHWINMQYNASVNDNLRYGSGNKVLHNVVGGHIGVFEGNGGDLRIGLPLQSIHNGERWMHTPLRLSVYLQAPAKAVEAIYQRHEMVQQLVDNDWLYLFRLGDDTTGERLYHNAWTPITGIFDKESAA